MSANENVRVRIDGRTKVAASNALAAMGLTVSDAIRMMLRRVAEEKRLPFDVTVPNADSCAADSIMFAHIPKGGYSWRIRSG